MFLGLLGWAVTLSVTDSVVNPPVIYFERVTSYVVVLSIYLHYCLKTIKLL